ncbi:MAG TPA: hypothetical protein VF580_00860 [Thermoanaerobaculia bacterium]
MLPDTFPVDLLTSIESRTADRKILEFAARGFVPLAPSDLARAVASILAFGDAGLKTIAEETFRTFSAGVLTEAVISEGVRGEQLDVISRRTNDPQVLEPLIRARAVTDETLAWLAERIPPNLQDVLITNQARLLAAPVIVERLFENAELSSDIRRRADEFLEEFFLKKIRLEQQLEAAEGTDHPEEVLTEAQEAVEQSSAPREAGAVLSEDEKKSFFARVALLTVVQRIRLAWTGTKEERLFLIHDTNRLVSAAVLKSPKTNESDAEMIANMKSVSEDVLRSIGNRREWVKKYSVMLALTKNSRAPVATTLPLIPRLTPKDQKTLSTDRNIPEVVRVTARRAVVRRDE